MNRTKQTSLFRERSSRCLPQLGRHGNSLVTVPLLLLLAATPVQARQLWVYGADYLWPVENSRDLSTSNINVYFRFHEARRPKLTFLAGLTGSYASGDITQSEGDLDQGTLREVRYRSGAGGVGPGALVEWRLLQRRWFSLHLFGSGSLLVYNKRFPAGGDRYNFMWRVGPSMRFAMGNHTAVGVGFQWMHVSNGQGVGPENPSYDARGLSLRLVRSF